MNALILAGGRGRRLGALTANCSKATLKFAGKSLLAHVILSTSILEKKVKMIYIATGYQSEAVKQAIEREIEALDIDTPIVVLPPEINLAGTFKSTVEGLKAAGITENCLVTGIDALVTNTTMSEFIAASAKKKKTVFMISPLLGIAPTHGFIRPNNTGQIMEYRKSSQGFGVSHSGYKWYSDVGIRYFDSSFINTCLSLPLTYPCDFDDVMPNLIKMGEKTQTHVISERWLHFGVSKDFNQKPLIQTK